MEVSHENPIRSLLSRTGERTRQAAVVVTPDRLGRFFPALLGLTLLFAALEAALAAVLHSPALGAAGGSTCVFAIGLIVAVGRMRAGHPAQARIAIAIALNVLGAAGAYLIPNVASATSLLPVVAVVLVLPHVNRERLLPLIVMAAVSALVILAVGHMPHPVAPLGDLAGELFQAATIVGVVVLVLLGLADFALEARDSLRDLAESTERQIKASAERLAIVASLRTLRALPTPEATAVAVANALSDLPLVEVAVIIEATEGGLTVLAAAGDPTFPMRVGHALPSGRAAYMLTRSGDGAWSEMWADRPTPGVDDELLVAFGVEGQAFAPIFAGGEMVGLVGIVTTRAEEAIHLTADLPAVSEFATVAGAILGPSLLARRQLHAAKVRVAETIASGAFHPVFQPVLDLETGQTVGYEALTRFAAGEAPDQVFAHAAQVGLGAQLERATLAAAIREAVRLPAGSWLSLNVSPALLAECDELVRLLADRTRPIVVEITEHDVILDYAPLHEAMRRLGPDVRLAVDDAGAGVANFRHLVELRPNIVKIDADLIRGVNADLSRQALIVGLVHFAAVSGAQVLAEGIETSAEQQTVQRLGVTLGQGYLFGRPAPVADWARRLPTESPSPRTPRIVALGA